MNKELHKGLRTWIEIDKKAIAHNYSVFRSHISKKTLFMAVVKSNAYGHNLVEFAKEIEKLGADYLGVDSIVEGITLRKNGIKKPILVLGYTLPENISLAIKNNIEITISSFETLTYIQKNNFRGLKVHIKVDTGMGRQGFLLKDIKKVLLELKKIKNIFVTGVYTHFSSAKNPAFPQYSNTQVDLFKNWMKVFKEAGYRVIFHASATSGTLLFPDAQFDMVRIGIGLYGIWPSLEVQAFMEGQKELKSVLSWKTIVGEIKKLPKGSKIGYDGTEVLKKESTIAIIPIGYWHGYPRVLSSIGHVLISGLRCKILGRVCMDIIIVDVSDLKKIKVGDEVVLIGKSGREEVTADDLALLSDTSPYEIITRINPLIKRIYQ